MLDVFNITVSSKIICSVSQNFNLIVVLLLLKSLQSSKVHYICYILDCTILPVKSSIKWKQADSFVTFLWILDLIYVYWILLFFLQRVLNPPIPEEILVTFHINCDKLAFNVFVLNILTAAPNSVSPDCVYRLKKAKISCPTSFWWRIQCMYSIGSNLLNVSLKCESEPIGKKTTNKSWCVCMLFSKESQDNYRQHSDIQPSSLSLSEFCSITLLCWTVT